MKHSYYAYITQVGSSIWGGKQRERFPAKFGRSGFRRNFVFDGVWRGKEYKTKQIEVYGVEEATDFIVITVVVKYF